MHDISEIEQSKIRRQLDVKKDKNMTQAFGPKSCENCWLLVIINKSPKSCENCLLLVTISKTIMIKVPTIA